MTTGETTEIKNCYNQLCVWPGILMPESENPKKEFEDSFKEEFNIRVKFCEQVFTNPDIDESGKPVPNTGGRSDLLFYIHDDDIASFTVKRLAYGIRWWEDVVSYNKQSYLYPEEILNKYPVRW